jgi:hypothetical protein
MVICQCNGYDLLDDVMDDVTLIPDVGASARRGAKRRAREQEIPPFLPRGRAKALGAARPSGRLCSYQPTPHRHMFAG